jgi:hypothetical protein
MTNRRRSSAKRRARPFYRSAAARPDTAAHPVALFVVGYARSGTSALTRVLSLCGATLPPGVLGAIKNYPDGFWEPRKAIHLNGAILRRHGSAGFDPTLRVQADGAVDATRKAAYIAKIRAFLATLPAAPLVVIKDPKITALSDLWFEAARQAGFHPMAVIAVRDPQEAIKSTMAAGGVSPKLGGALWLKYSLLAEKGTRGMPRVFVEYTSLMDNWRREMKRISATLAIDLGTRDEVAIEEFLTPSLRDHRRSGPVTELFGTDWVSAAYEALGAAARDEPWDQSALDRVYESYRSCEADFRTASEEFHRLQKIYRLIPISVVKLFIEVNAIARRRRDETWA